MYKKSTISSLGNVQTILDWTFFRDFIHSDEELEVEILSIFFDSAPSYIEAIKIASIEEWPAACHKLKGAARSIGAWALAYQTELAEFAPPPEVSSDSRMDIISTIQGSFTDLQAEASIEHAIFRQ